MAIQRAAEGRVDLRWSAISSSDTDPADVVNRGVAEWIASLTSYTYVYRFAIEFAAAQSFTLDFQSLSFRFMNNDNDIAISALRFIQLIVAAQPDGQPVADDSVDIGNAVASPHMDLFGGKTSALLQAHAAGGLMLVNPTNSWDSSAGQSGFNITNKANVPQHVTFYAAGD